jgi:hypothetical protein
VESSCNCKIKGNTEERVVMVGSLADIRCSDTRVSLVPRSSALVVVGVRWCGCMHPRDVGYHSGGNK